MLSYFYDHIVLVSSFSTPSSFLIHHLLSSILLYFPFVLLRLPFPPSIFLLFTSSPTTSFLSYVLSAAPDVYLYR